MEPSHYAFPPMSHPSNSHLAATHELLNPSSQPSLRRRIVTRSPTLRPLSCPPVIRNPWYNSQPGNACPRPTRSHYLRQRSIKQFNSVAGIGMADNVKQQQIFLAASTSTYTAGKEGASCRLKLVVCDPSCQRSCFITYMLFYNSRERMQGQGQEQDEEQEMERYKLQAKLVTIGWDVHESTSTSPCTSPPLTEWSHRNGTCMCVKDYVCVPIMPRCSMIRTS